MQFGCRFQRETRSGVASVEMTRRLIADNLPIVLITPLLSAEGASFGALGRTFLHGPHCLRAG